MKIPKAKQLPSGSWFCRVRVDGKDVGITRPTEKEAVAEAMAVKAGIVEAKKSGKKTLTDAIDDYIDARKNVVSPSTIRGYRAIQKGRFKAAMRLDLYAATVDQWQRAVSTEARLCSAKTLTNAWRFVSSVIFEATGQRITVRLPQVVANERPFLEPEQIPVFVAAVRGTSVEIPALLALSSLRRSEFMALRWSDVDLGHGVIHVSGAAVYGPDGKLVRKNETKNKSSRRTVPIIPPLRAAFESASREGELVVNMAPNAIMLHINRICKRNGLPEVGLHGLRHSFASLAYHLGMPEKVAMEIGGWSNDQTMRRIYTHISKRDIADHAAAFVGFFDQNGNENGNEVQKAP